MMDKRGLIFLILGGAVIGIIPIALFGWTVLNIGWWLMIVPMNIGLVCIKKKWIDKL